MKKNRIVIDDIIINRNRIDYSYTVTGEWKKCFNLNEKFYIEYGLDLASLPKSIAVVPLLANLLPIAWIYDAEIVSPVCDKAFYDSIPNFKKGYVEMYPMMEFKGNLCVNEIQENHPGDEGGSAAFFSGGVDAFNTLVCHANEHPTLLTIWGADVKFEDTEGWNKVHNHLSETCRNFNVDSVVIKSCFRRFLDEWELEQRVAPSGDGWWHGFQHGIGIISHAAPVAYLLKKKSVYIASSFTLLDKGQVSCASDPTIDNFVKFGDTEVIHDGYEFDRSMKIHNISTFHNNTGIDIQLRVCWESTGGSNCCNCEKCWRTIIGLYAENQDPKKYGFDYEDFHSLCHKIYQNRHLLHTRFQSRWEPIQKKLHQNYTLKNIEPSLKWLYKVNVSKFGKESKIINILKRIKRKIYRIIN